MLFDLDGTLVDSAPSIARSLNLALGTTLPVEVVRTLIGDGAVVLVERALRAAGLPPDPEAPGRFLRTYAAEGIRGTTALPGAHAVLAQLPTQGWRLGLVTNKPMVPTRQLLEGFGWAGSFGVVIAGDSLPQRKPRPEPLWAALDALGVPPSQAVMVGDSGNDAQAARAAGVPVVLVAGGYSNEPLQALGADQVLPNLLGLGALLDQLRLRW